jgi:hypothetical protein
MNVAELIHELGRFDGDEPVVTTVTVAGGFRTMLEVAAVGLDVDQRDNHGCLLILEERGP